MTRTRLLLCSLMLGASLSAQAEMRVYDVDEQYREEIFRALNNILTAANQRGMSPGRAQLLPNGQILVDATEARHTEIEAVLDAVERLEPPAARSVSLRYWVLFAVPGRPESADALPPLLESVGRELEAAHGELSFTVLDTAMLVGLPSRGARSESETLEISQVVEPAGSRINATIRIQTLHQEVSVDATLERGDFLVLGESQHEDESGTQGTIAFVVHWPEPVD